MGSTGECSADNAGTEGGREPPDDGGGTRTSSLDSPSGSSRPELLLLESSLRWVRR